MTLIHQQGGFGVVLKTRGAFGGSTGVYRDYIGLYRDYMGCSQNYGGLLYIYIYTDIIVLQFYLGVPNGTRIENFQHLGIMYV